MWYDIFLNKKFHKKISNYSKGYPEFGRHLNSTGRAMVYSCSWPVYQIYAGISVSLGAYSVLLSISQFNFFKFAYF
jgi:Alpha galactosidase A